MEVQTDPSWNGMSLPFYISLNIFPCIPYISAVKNYLLRLEQAMSFYASMLLPALFLIWIALALANSLQSFRTRLRGYLSQEASCQLSLLLLWAVLMALVYGFVTQSRFHFLVCLFHQIISSLKSGSMSVSYF